MADLYRRLRAVGLTKRYVRRTILPDWWDDQIAENPAGFAEGLIFLSRHLGLDLSTLRDPQSPVAFRNFGVCKFKKSSNATENELALARAMATRAAQLASAAMADPALPLPTSGSQIRGEILGQGEPWVSLSNLAEYCWSVGIPVIHLSSFPKAKRPDGLAARVQGRPVIVLCKQARYSAWLLFILAHELGHIALGHVTDDGVLLDESMDRNVDDLEEDAANQFAIELLTGDPRICYRTSGRWPNALQLASAARETGKERGVDPGHIVLNYAHTMGKDFFPVANAALAELEPKKDAMKIVRQQMAAHLDWSSLPEDSSEFLMRVSQAERTA
ncbi:MAG: ImmA/IrrE family metallo-endopeptidase [Isosphaeraceae bacterium]